MKDLTDTVNKFLARFKSRPNIYPYEVMCDSTNNNQDTIAKGELHVDITMPMDLATLWHLHPGYTIVQFDKAGSEITTDQVREAFEQRFASVHIYETSSCWFLFVSNNVEE